MAPLRITLVAPFGLRRRGTTRARVVPLACALARRGHSVHVLIPDWDCPQDAGRRYVLRGAVVQHLGVRPGGDGPFSIPLLQATYRAALDRQPDVVHCFKPIGYAGAIALLLSRARRSGIPTPRVILDTDDLEGRQGWAAQVGRPAWQVAVLAAQERLALRVAPRVTAASHYLARRAAALRGSGRGVQYLPNGVTVPRQPGSTAFVPAASVSAPTGAPICTFVVYTRFNEFAPARGAALIGRLLRALCGARLRVVGDGDALARQEFDRALRGLVDPSRVEYCGFLPGEALWSALASADVALWPFDDTPINRARCPAKFLELLALGLPTVAEAVGEVGRLGGPAARLVAPGDAAAFCDAALDLAASEKDRAKLSRVAMTWAANEHAWEARAASLERMAF